MIYVDNEKYSNEITTIHLFDNIEKIFYCLIYLIQIFHFLNTFKHYLNNI
jgi:hypothetical protein